MRAKALYSSLHSSAEACVLRPEANASVLRPKANVLSCLIFRGTTNQNEKMYQMIIKYTKCRRNIPNRRQVDHPHLTQIGIFGLKIYHLATLV
jgi:hypothetical protein